jgi:hypothetical protein
MLEGPVDGRTLVEVTMMEGMPDYPYTKAGAAKACDEKITFRTIYGL